MNQHSAREETVSKRRARGEGHIYQRGRIWWIQYYCNGDEYSKAPTLKTRAQPRVYCVAVSARWRRELVVRIGKDGKPYLCGCSTLNAYFQEPSRRGLSRSGCRLNYPYTFNNLLLYRSGLSAPSRMSCPLGGAQAGTQAVAWCSRNPRPRRHHAAFKRIIRNQVTQWTGREYRRSKRD